MTAAELRRFPTLDGDRTPTDVETLTVIDAFVLLSHIQDGSSIDFGAEQLTDAVRDSLLARGFSIGPSGVMPGWKKISW